MHRLKGMQDLLDVIDIWVEARCIFFYLLHYQDVFGQPLNRFYQIVLKSEFVVLVATFYLVDELPKPLVLLIQFISQSIRLSKIIEILEIQLKKVYFLLHLIKYHLVVTIVLTLVENSSKKDLV